MWTVEDELNLINRKIAKLENEIAELEQEKFRIVAVVDDRLNKLYPDSHDEEF